MLKGYMYLKVLTRFVFLAISLPFATACEKQPGDEPFSAYLFAYFVGNGPGEEAIHFAVSEDGFNFHTLNSNKPVIAADTISSRGGVRDPHILRGEDGMFYMVVTDLYVPRDGWNNNIAMVFLKSENLLDWTSSVVKIPDLFPEFHDVYRVWAPQTIYDKQKGKYMVYFSMIQPGGHDIIYYSYANDDFTSLESTPRQLFYHPDSIACIDGDIVNWDGKYHLFFKTEGGEKGLKKAVSANLTDGYEMIDKYLHKIDAGVEGSCVYRLIDSDTFILMYDVYTLGRYQFTKSTDLLNFEVIDHKVSMDFRPRHGTVIHITKSELEALREKWQ